MAFVYSCCFWFSLRLGGIMIGIFSLLQSLLLLIIWSLVYTYPKQVIDILTDWLNTLDLGYYMKSLLESIKSDPQGSASLFITLICIFIAITLMFIYGAYKCNTVLMVAYIVVETARLLALSVLVANSLLLLKQNTMDIGLLIGASVAAGFFLLGLFYLWVCIINLPIVINESQLDEQAATISKLQQLLDLNKPRTFASGADNLAYESDYMTSNNMFVISRNRFIKRNI